MERQAVGLTRQELYEKIWSRPASESGMKNRPATACARSGNIDTRRQLNELVRFDRNEPMISLCGECLHLLKYADASSWKWFREYRDRLIKTKTGQRD